VLNAGPGLQLKEDALIAIPCYSLEIYSVWNAAQGTMAAPIQK